MTSKNIDRAKGRLKETPGALTGSEGLKTEGRVDHAKGSMENAVEKVADTLIDSKRTKR
jgi:uncharacterized protein YjbJ (UPF0337 family)